MGLFNNLISIFSATSTPTRESSTSPRDGGFTVTIMGPTEQPSSVHVSDAEVAERAQAHSFVLTTDPPPLKTADRWWDEATHKRRVREGSEKAYAWLPPFVPIEVAKLEQLRPAQKWGPHGAGDLAKELRALIRGRRKAKQPHENLLQALYGACVLADLAASLEFEGTQPHAMTRYVDINELQAVRCDYSTMAISATSLCPRPM